MTSQTEIQRFGETLAKLDVAVDWDRVATSYCEGDATGFLDEDRRGAVLDTGLKFASDIEEALSKRKDGPGGRSLYLGAGVAELAPMLFESIVLGRKVAWITLESEESKVLARALKAIDAKLPRPRTTALIGKDLRPRDHVWMTSVLTDPDAFPALHDKLYQRQGTKEAIGGGKPKAERARAATLVTELLDAAAADSLLSTTDEELKVWEPMVIEAGGRLEVPTTGRTSGLVGDVVRLCRLRPR